MKRWPGARDDKPVLLETIAWLGDAALRRGGGSARDSPRALLFGSPRRLINRPLDDLRFFGEVEQPRRSLPAKSGRLRAVPRVPRRPAGFSTWERVLSQPSWGFFFSPPPSPSLSQV